MAAKSSNKKWYFIGGGVVLLVLGFIFKDKIMGLLKKKDSSQNQLIGSVVSDKPIGKPVFVNPTLPPNVQPKVLPKNQAVTPRRILPSPAIRPKSGGVGGGSLQVIQAV